MTDMDSYKTILEYIMNKAVRKAEEAAEDGCCHTCGEWMDIAKDAAEVMEHLHISH